MQHQIESKTMKYISFIIILTVSVILNNLYCQEAFHLKSGRDINVSLDSREAPVVKAHTRFYNEI